MSAFRQSVRTAALFILLLGVIAVPGILMEHQNSGVLDDVTPYSVKMIALENENAGKEETDKQNIWERIGMINRASTQVQSIEYTPLRTNGELCRKMEEQLGILQELGAIPKIDVAEPIDGTYTKRVYMDSEQPELAVSVWVINAAYQDAFLSVYMDVETSVIYDVFLNANPGVSFVDRTDNAIKAFFEYLNAFSGNETFAEKESSIFCSYAKDKVCLSVTYTNTQTKDYMVLDGALKEYTITKR